MTVAQQSGITHVAGNGAMTEFAFPFIAVAPVYVSVLYTDPAGMQTLLQQGPGPGQYQVTMSAPAAGAIWGVGGIVVYNPNGVPIPVGSTLTIMRTLPVAQPISLVNHGSLETLGFGAETADDLLVLLMQQYTDALARALQMNPANSAPPLPLPPAAQAAGKLLAFDPTGNNVIAASILPQGMVSSAMQPVVAAASLVLGRTALGAIGTLSIQMFSASGTYTAPWGLLWAIVECVGGGGSGGSVWRGGAALGGGGGGSGGYSRSILSAVQIGLSQPVTVGAGGVTQSPGGDTLFGNSLVVARGGAAGQPSDGVSQFGSGGFGGAPGIGQLALPGSHGSFGLATTTPLNTIAYAGVGGDLFGGSGQQAAISPSGTAVGNPALGGTGAGGGGAVTNADNVQAPAPGGAGGSGWCLVTEFSA